MSILFDLHHRKGECESEGRISLDLGRHSGAPRSGEPGIHNHRACGEERRLTRGALWRVPRVWIPDLRASRAIRNDDGEAKERFRVRSLRERPGMTPSTVRICSQVPAVMLKSLRSIQTASEAE